MIDHKDSATSLPDGFLQAVPKTDLHVHLDGSLRIPTLIELARAESVELPSYEEQGLRETVFKPNYADLGEYLRGFSYTCAVLNGPEHFERVACELAEDNILEGVRYIEVRFAPQLHVRPDFTVDEILGAVDRGLRNAANAHNCSDAVLLGGDLPFEYGLIVCAMRCFHPEMSQYYAKLLDVQSRAPRRDVFSLASLEMARTAVALRDELDLPITGFDLAGEEAGYPAYYHREAYSYAHTHFLKKTVHAGEAYGPESIFQAITICHANRIGHGTFLLSPEKIQDAGVADPEQFVQQLADYIASQRITLEVCLTSNLQTTPSIPDIASHPVKSMLDHGLALSICTDNRLVSNTTVTHELKQLVAAVPVTRHQFRNLIIAGFKGSFFPGSYNSKRAYVRRVLARYARLELDWFGETSHADIDQEERDD